MKRILSLAILAVMAISLCACAAPATSSVKLTEAKSLADLKGAKIASQAGTFHQQAVSQIEGVVASTYPDFTDLLIALQSGAIDGYVAEEPTALSVCLTDPTLTYVPLKNNSTGFTTTAADVGVAIGLNKGSELREEINAVLATIDEATRKALMEKAIRAAAGEAVEDFTLGETDRTDGPVLRVAMECAYQPFNWTRLEQGANTVPIQGEGKSGTYADGYDVQVARYVAAKLGRKLEIYAMEWDSLIPAVQSGAVDAIVAGMSPTAERAQEIDFTDCYYESDLVVVIRK